MKIYIILFFIHICNASASSNIKNDNLNPQWIYEIDGIEYIDSSLRNDTLRVVLQ
jgi:hypothetical protein